MSEASLSSTKRKKEYSADKIRLYNECLTYCHLEQHPAVRPSDDQIREFCASIQQPKSIDRLIGYRKCLDTQASVYRESTSKKAKTAEHKTRKSMVASEGISSLKDIEKKEQDKARMQSVPNHMPPWSLPKMRRHLELAQHFFASEDEAKAHLTKIWLTSTATARYTHLGFLSRHVKRCQGDMSKLQSLVSFNFESKCVPSQTAAKQVSASDAELKPLNSCHDHTEFHLLRSQSSSASATIDNADCADLTIESPILDVPDRSKKSQKVYETNPAVHLDCWSAADDPFYHSIIGCDYVLKHVEYQQISALAIPRESFVPCEVCRRVTHPDETHPNSMRLQAASQARSKAQKRLTRKFKNRSYVIDENTSDQVFISTRDPFYHSLDTCKKLIKVDYRRKIISADTVFLTFNFMKRWLPCQTCRNRLTPYENIPTKEMLGFAVEIRHKLSQGPLMTS
jgi:hypothetical protein